jgi:hypothetical protein
MKILYNYIEGYNKSSFRKMKLKMPNWLWKIIYRKSKIAGKNVFFDTNCYRGLARHYDKAKLEKLMKKIRTKEKRRRINTGLSYLVASEMFAHLGDPTAYNSYQECKLGLYAALQHIANEPNKMLPGPDSELHQFIFGTLPHNEAIRQRSLIDSILLLGNHSFDDTIIQNNSVHYQRTKQYLQQVKDSWLDSFTNYFIMKHEPGFQGGWQIFAQDPARRTVLLNEINKAEASGGIYREFSVGVCLYIINGFNIQNPLIDEVLLQKVIERFKPIFQLQLYIIKNICQGGYNLQKRQNDITDYLIMTSFDPSSTIFVSNESRHLVPNLYSFGYNGKVFSLNQYLKILRIKDRVPT